MNSKNKIIRQVGTIMMIAPIIIIAVIYYPYIKLYLFPPKIDEKNLSKEFSIVIPKINAAAPIIKNVDPFNEQEYKKILKNGIAHANTTALPRETGTIFLFAHSSDLPWQITRYNTAFFRLHDLEKGDEVYIFYEGIKTPYRITDIKTVKPNEVKFLQNSGKEQLILQTCTPIGTSINRLLVFAEPTN